MLAGHRTTKGVISAPEQARSDWATGCTSFQAGPQGSVWPGQRAMIQAVPSPHTGLSQATPQHSWGSCPPFPVPLRRFAHPPRCGGSLSSLLPGPWTLCCLLLPVARTHNPAHFLARAVSWLFCCLGPRSLAPITAGRTHPGPDPGAEPLTLSSAPEPHPRLYVPISQA